MQRKKAIALQQAWGDRPCDHPDLAREYDAEGERTGNYVCTQCGAILTFRERAALRDARGEAPRNDAPPDDAPRGNTPRRESPRRESPRGGSSRGRSPRRD